MTGVQTCALPISYKAAWSHEDAVAEILAQSGSHFDPQVVKIFTELLERRRQDAVTLPGTPALGLGAD